MEENSKRYSLIIPVKEWELIEAESEREGITAKAVIRQCIAEHFSGGVEKDKGEVAVKNYLVRVLCQHFTRGEMKEIARFFDVPLLPSEDGTALNVATPLVDFLSSVRELGKLVEYIKKNRPSEKLPYLLALGGV